MAFYFAPKGFFDDDKEREKIYYIKRTGAKVIEEKSIDIKFKTSRITKYFNSVRSYNSNAGGRFSKPVKQSVVKLLSNLNATGTKNALNYIVRNSEIGCLIDESGNKVSVSDILKDWGDDFSKNQNAKDSWHLCFSIKEENRSSIQIKNLENAVREVMDENFFGYKYALCIHNHQNNPHIHIVLNKRNIFTGKKIHFDSGSEIKNFFDILRDDFADSLNARGFNYVNVNSQIKDLEKEFEKVEKKLNSNNNTKEKITEIFSKIQLNSENDYLARKNQQKHIDNEIEKLIAKKDDLSALYLQYKKKNNKKYFSLGKELKVLENEIKILCKMGIENNKEIKAIEREFEKVVKAKKELFLCNDDNYRIVRDFCFTFEKEFLKSKRFISKDLVEKYFAYKKELNELGNHINGTLKDSVDSAILYQKTFNKNETCFDIVKKYKNVDENLYIVKSSQSLSDIEKSEYEMLLKKNKDFLFDLFIKRFKKVNDELKKGGNDKNIEFLKKEFLMAQKLLFKNENVNVKNNSSGGKDFENNISQAFWAENINTKGFTNINDKQKK